MFEYKVTFCKYSEGSSCIRKSPKLGGKPIHFAESLSKVGPGGIHGVHLFLTLPQLFWASFPVCVGSVINGAYPV